MHIATKSNQESKIKTFHSQVHLAETKQNLSDAFWQLYCEKRIDKITVKEITTKAGYNRGTFYEYYIDVYDVLEQIENALLPKPEEFPTINFQGGLPPSPIDDFIKMYMDNSKAE